MKITVLGCGALGQLWLTALCKHGHDVQGWLRVPQPYCSVNLIDTDGSFFNESLTANDPDFLAKSELLLVTLKAWQVSDAVRTLASTLPVTSPILLIHNGMGTIEELQNIQQPMLMGTITHAARRDGNIIIHVANGTTHIGPAREQDGDYSYLAEILQGYCPMSPGITTSAQRCGANWRLTVLSTRSPHYGTARTARCAIILMKLTRFAKRSPP